MKNRNLFSMLMIVAIALAIGIGCDRIGKPSGEIPKTVSENNASKAENKSVANETVEPVAVKSEKSVKDKKADFIVTAVVLNNEFRAKGKKDEDFSKYKNKVIQIGGLISGVYPDKKDSIQPHISFSDGGFGMASTCYFDDEEAPKVKDMKERQSVMLKCMLEEEDIFAGMPPSLRHCEAVEKK